MKLKPKWVRPNPTPMPSSKHTQPLVLSSELKTIISVTYTCWLGLTVPGPMICCDTAGSFTIPPTLTHGHTQLLPNSRATMTLTATWKCGGHLPAHPGLQNQLSSPRRECQGKSRQLPGDREGQAQPDLERTLACVSGWLWSRRAAQHSPRSMSVQRVHEPPDGQTARGLALVCNHSPHPCPQDPRPQSGQRAAGQPISTQRGPAPEANSVGAGAVSKDTAAGGRPALSARMCVGQGCPQLGEEFPWTPI